MPAKRTTSTPGAPARSKTAPKRAKGSVVRHVGKSVEPPVVITEMIEKEEIAKLAYSYWEARGYEGGSPEEDWFRAETQVREKSLAARA